ncbi:uncharacterized protein LOC106636428 [Copidosoma floridanum]|uniref:uncharacterized protein LOC106636428 n=1 Tax=Copidosoma floridanum TaxID=29053 RepID=UPI0006C970A4|nr:uncharacterized protein LOC106636428 [Copidosoma floridanum]
MLLQLVVVLFTTQLFHVRGHAYKLIKNKNSNDNLNSTQAKNIHHHSSNGSYSLESYIEGFAKNIFKNDSTSPLAPLTNFTSFAADSFQNMTKMSENLVHGLEKEVKKNFDDAAKKVKGNIFRGAIGAIFG